MNTYRIQYKINLKEYVQTIEAKHEIHAKNIIRDRIVFTKVEKVVKMPKPPIDEDETLEHIKNIFGMK